MNLFKIPTLICLGLFLILSSCRDDIIESTITETTPDPTIIEGYNPKIQGVTSSLVGRVVDEEQNGIENALVTLNEYSTTTNEYGHFFFNQVEMNAKGTFVSIKKEGYFDGSRRFYPVENKSSRIKIELLDQTFNQSFDASIGGAISSSDGVNLEFPPNAIRDENGELYEGNVGVAVRWLDPTATPTLDRMPGDLTGVDQLNNEVALGTFGMLAVELRSQDGSELNIVQDKQATLRFPVPDEIIAAAPQEIPLWYFNERYGIWAQDGVATLVGDAYIGSVSHFSFWNCDVPYELVNLDFTITDDNGNPLANHLVVIGDGGSSSGSGRSDENGFVSGKVPANTTLDLEVFSSCGDVIYSSQIGPFSIDSSLGTIAISNSGSVNITTVTGNLLNCDGNPVTNGLVIIEFGGNSEFLYTVGAPFTFSVTTCPGITSAKVTSIDFDNPGHTAEATVSTGTSTSLGDIDVCNISGPENTITVDVDGAVFVYSNATADIGSVDSVGTYFESRLGNDLYCGFQVQSISAGTHDAYVEAIVNVPLDWNLFPANSVQSITITEFGPNTGDKIIGSGSFMMYNRNDLVNVTISFDITRE